MPFVDETVLVLSSGHGGPGASTFRREKHAPRGGPDGGDGGRGGDVIFVVRKNLKTLAHLSQKKAIHAENGKPGTKRKKHGSDGASAVIEVPPGTLIREVDTGALIKDLTTDESWLFLSGGKGGRGNVWFKSSTRQAPRYAQHGLPGSSAKVLLELNLIADVGFVGFPNAGKSTLLDILTNAHPEIAAYPFTTKIPNLGVLKIGYQEIVLADIPGIIEGAAHGAGLGLRFLKHISRTRALAFVVDLGEPDPHHDYRVLLGEIAQYDRSLLDKPRFVVGAKLDLPEASSNASLLTKALDESVVCLSAHTHEGLDLLIEKLKRMCQAS